MIRRIRNTFDWEYMLRFFMAAAVTYVLGTAVLHDGVRFGGPAQAGSRQAATR